MSVTQMPTAKPVDYTNRPATEDARLRMLSRVPAGYTVEVDPNAAPVVQPDGSGGSPVGSGGRTMNVDQWLRHKGITTEDETETDNRPARIRPENVRYEKPVVDPVSDETDIDLTIGEKVFRIKMRGGEVREIPMGETELRNLGMVQFREQSVSKFMNKINEIDPDSDTAEADALRYNEKLHVAQRELLILLVPTFRDHPDVVAILPLERYQRIIDTAQRYNALRLGAAVEGTPEEVAAYDAYRRRLREARENGTGNPNAQSGRRNPR